LLFGETRELRAAPAEASEAARGGSCSRGWTWNLGRVAVRHPWAKELDFQIRRLVLVVVRP